MSPRIQALVLLALVSAALLMFNMTTGATFTAPTTNPSNQLATATLAAPTGVSATVQANGGTVRVAWTATSSAWASGHRIYRATASGGPYTLVQQVAGLATVAFDDTPGVGIFYYVVRGYYNANGANWESTSSALASAKPLDHFGFNAIAGQHSGTAFSVTIVAQAQDNSTVSAFSGTVSFSAAAGSVAPAGSNAFVNGSLTQNVTVTGPYTPSETISVTGGSPARTGTSGAFTLNHFRATAIALNNAGIAGRPESGDTVVLTFSEAANTASLGTCPSGDSSTDLLTNDANPDTLSASGANLTFGTISLGANGYFTSSDTAKKSSCAWSAGKTVLTITLAGVKSTGTVAGGSTATWTPASSLVSAAGEAIDTAQRPTVTGVLF
jgi:hypothetical protein